MNRTREEILWDIELHTKWAEDHTEWAEDLFKRAEINTKRAEINTKWAEEAKQELKAFDEANK